MPRSRLMMGDMVKVVGTCSICSGRVSVPEIWFGVIPPVPKCEKCGARATEDYGPVVQMKPAAQPSAGFAREYLAEWKEADEDPLGASAAEEIAKVLEPFESRCTRPPSGWECSRIRGHEGPCAASISGRPR